MSTNRYMVAVMLQAFRNNAGPKLKAAFKPSTGWDFNKDELIKRIDDTIALDDKIKE